MIGRRLLVPILLLGVLLPGASAAGRGSRGSDFAEQVRTLLLLQDAAAAGHADATGLQKDVIIAITRQFAGGLLPEPTSRNLRAAISYTLSGGPPDIAEGLAVASDIDPQLKLLLEATVRFKRGETEEAAKKLATIEVLKLPPSIGGRVALMQSMVTPENDVARRLTLLAIAADQMPGTLVEEAALRRTILVAAVAEDLARFWRSADRYLRRFDTSLYAAALVSSLVDEIIRLEAKSVQLDRNRLQLLFGRLPVASRVSAYLLMAQRATGAGLADLAQFSASRARRLSAEGSSAWQRAELYDAVHGITTGNFDLYEMKLRRIEPALLTLDDRNLLIAALAVTTRIHAAAAADGPNPMLYAASLQLSPEQLSLQQRGEAALRRADELLAAAGLPSTGNENALSK
ncbi:MAG: hypothetical protein HY245_04975 [Rhizobiales bacterium]|nr:hypothetical protein [Hyphomicrobiales bacterium]MBI3672767.1 hypothetical protein [Hyphomicrobiales bacterium]